MIRINNKTLCEYCFEETDREPCPHCGFSREAYVNDPMVLAVGNILENRYIVGGVIGKGGFGITYLAYDKKLERKVAVKEYYPYGLAMRNLGSTFVSTVSGESVEMFKGGADKFYDEARLVAKFNDNPNIVSVYDFFYGNDTVYFTMGFLRGQTLKSYIRDHGVLTAGQTVQVAKDVTNALLAAHHLNVLHRDISPDNIMVCSDGTIKLLDFGAARQVLTEGSQSLSVILKQGFAPLEQYQKKGKQGPWTDIYALGATMYYALTLDLLDDPMSRLEDDSEYSSNIHGIDEALWKIIHKATMLRSSERYSDIRKLQEALEALPIRPEALAMSEDSADKVKFEPASGTSHSLSGGENTMPVMAKTVGYAEAGSATMPVSESVGVTQALKEEAYAGQKSNTGIQTSVAADQMHSPKEQPAEKKKISRKQCGIIVGAVALVVFLMVWLLRSLIHDDAVSGNESTLVLQQSGESEYTTDVFDSIEDESGEDSQDYTQSEIQLEATSASLFEYGTKNKNTIITKYIGQETEVVIPHEIEGYPIVKLGEYAFGDCYNMTSVIIPDSVTELGDSVFEACSSLTSVTIPDGVTSIPKCAFCRCGSLTSVTIPEGVTSIGRAAFSDCSSLNNITIPDSVTEIDEYAFSNCPNLTDVTIPEHTKVAPNAFVDSPNVTVNGVSIADMFQPDATPVSSFEYRIEDNNVIIEKFVGQETEVVIPREIEEYPVTAINYYAFENCNSLTRVTIPDSVTSIGSGAFKGCSSLNSVIIPSGVTVIEDFMFEECSGLTSVTIPDSVTKIGNTVFKKCSSLTSITIPTSVTEIGENVFWDCSSLTRVEIPAGVTKIGEWTFSGCSSLTSITIPVGVTEIGEWTFEGCSSLTNVEIPTGVTKIGKRAFDGCSSLTSMVIPASVTEIGEYAFSDCSGLTGVVIPVGVTKIDKYAFSDCSSLTSVVIPDSVIEIGNWAFDGCSNLTTVIIPEHTTVAKYAFNVTITRVTSTAGMIP